MENPTTALESQIELEKMEIPVPEKTLEAAVERANAIAKKLRASKSTHLSALQVKKLSRIASELRADIVETGIISDENENDFSLEVPSDTQQCAEEFECFGEECQDAADQINEQKIEAGEKIVRIAKSILASRKEVSPAKLKACLRKIIADATKLDLMRNLSNIENKSQKDQTLRILVDWDEVSKLSPGVNKATKLQDLKVQDLKNVLVSIRGGRSVKED